MSSKLRVDELRAQLSLRGLDTSGTKPTLVQRLDEAIRKEEEKKTTSGSDSKDASLKDGRKRQRDSTEDGHDDDGHSVEDLQEMGVRELRELAAQRGVSTKGSKKELVARLSVDKEAKKSSKGKEVVEGPEVTTVEEEDSEEKKKEKLVVATKKGAAVLDQWIPEKIKSQFHVLQRGEDIFDAILNQTNVGDNNNKFYAIQALESDDGKSFMVYNRWGRVGVKGQDKLLGPYQSRDDAVNEFCVKFYDKTKNLWHDRKDFKSHPKCYTWLEMDYSEKDTVTEKTAEAARTEPSETKLDKEIAKFISLICDVSMMNQQMLEIGYNAEKLPLGKLSRTTILKGYEVLKKISDVIQQADRKVLEQLSGEFYTVIPHDFGFKKMREFVIDTPSKLKNKLEMVEALGEIEIATKILKDDPKRQDDPMFYRYQQLQCELTPVEANSDDFVMVEKYMQNTHAKTHAGYTVDIVQLFKASRQGEADRFQKFSNTKNRMLLWHGSRLTNWTGILSQGLRIAPPEAPSTGYMFGKGVYFADMFSKSANYCYASRHSREGVLLLCEVALGDMSELLSADYNANRLPEGKLSTKGVGSTAPDMSESSLLEDVVVPLGKPVQQAGRKGSLLYNEYIVYNVDQIRMRYVIRVSFNFR